jgi:hypothetical protein
MTSIPAAPPAPPAPTAPTGAVRSWLRLEGCAVLLLAIALYARGDHSWILFVVLFLAPDLSFAGYLAGPRVGAVAYNLVHSYLGPAVLAAALLLAGLSPALPIIWAGHIGFDRALGYGLKYPTGFSDTHLGRIGRGRAWRSP